MDRNLEERINALEIALKVGFNDLGNKIENAGASSTRATASGNRGSAIAWFALLVAVLALWIAYENRGLILAIQTHQVAQYGGQYVPPNTPSTTRDP